MPRAHRLLQDDGEWPVGMRKVWFLMSAVHAVTGQAPQAFRSKSARKAYRKSLRPKQMYRNAKADREIRKESKQQFYRNLRLIKINRKEMARQLVVLAGSMDDLDSDAYRVLDRVRGVDEGLVVTASALARVAVNEVMKTASQVEKFANKRVFYRKGVVH